MATTGVVGQRWRAHVTEAGAVEPHDGSPPLRWYVFAGDRWLDPARVVGTRHRRVNGTAVFETRMRLPGGDAVQTVWSVADHGGYTVVSVDNDSPLAIAVAFSRGGLATTRRPADVPLVGIDLPADAIVLPIGHRASATVGIRHDTRRDTTMPEGLPASAAVVRGWVTSTDRASRLELPQQPLVESVRAARCELLLGGLVESAVDPQRFLLGLGELLRLGELRELGEIGARAEDARLDVAAAANDVARRRDPLRRAALTAAATLLHAAGEGGAVDDLVRLRDTAGQRASAAITELPGDGDVAAVASVEGRLADGTVLFPAGIPSSWRGSNFEVHGLVAGPASRLSLAVRWHGDDPALLWEVTGERVTLTADLVAGGRRWSTSERRGEALLRGLHRSPARH